MHILASLIPGDPFARGAHRKPADFSGARYMLQVAGLAAVLFLLLMPLVGASPARAATAPHYPWQVACHDFTAWEQHPTAAHLDSLVAESFKVRDKYLASDIGQLYADVRGGGDLDVDRQYIADDCGLGGM